MSRFSSTKTLCSCLLLVAVKADSLFLSQSKHMSKNWGLDSELKCQGYAPGIENNKLFEALVTDNNQMPVELSNMTFYRSDWYSYCYSYYEGEFYDYYDNYYTKNINNTIDFAAEHYNIDRDWASQ